MKDKGKFVLQFVIAILIGAMVCGTVSASTFANEGVKKLADVQNDYSPHYSPNGKEIVFSSADYQKDPNQASIWIMNLASGSINKVNIPDSQWLYYVDWNQNGKQIIFTGGSYPSYPGKIYTINIDGTGKTLLAQDNEPCNAHYSLDGSKIVYEARESDHTSINHIWKMDADGSNKIQLINDNNEEMGARFSPDGKKIVYSSGSSLYSNIWIMDFDGLNKKQLTNDNVLERAPAWSPNGKYIAYQKSTGVNQPWNLWVMNADGSEQTQLTDYTKDGIDGVAPNWSPNGEKLVFCSGGFNSQNLNWDIYEMTLKKI